MSMSRGPDGRFIPDEKPRKPFVVTFSHALGWMIALTLLGIFVYVCILLLRFSVEDAFGARLVTLERLVHEQAGYIQDHDRDIVRVYKSTNEMIMRLVETEARLEKDELIIKANDNESQAEFLALHALLDAASVRLKNVRDPEVMTMKLSVPAPAKKPPPSKISPSCWSSRWSGC